MEFKSYHDMTLEQFLFIAKTLCLISARGYIVCNRQTRLNKGSMKMTHFLSLAWSGKIPNVGIKTATELSDVFADIWLNKKWLEPSTYLEAETADQDTGEIRISRFGDTRELMEYLNESSTVFGERLEILSAAQKPTTVGEKWKIINYME